MVDTYRLGQLALGEQHGFVLRGALIAERGVHAVRIIPAFDVAKDGALDLRAGGPGTAVDELRLERGEEALGDGVS